MTSEITWQTSYEIGVEEIDNEHKIFLKTIQKIDNAFKHECDFQQLALLIDELYKYAQFHFTSEENIMIFSQYPKYEEHRQIHRKLLIQLSELLGYQGNMRIKHHDFIDFLLNWFTDHTIKTDLNLAEFLCEKNKL